MQPNNLAKEVRKLLPGTDCTGRGGCGFATCDECAAAIAEGGPANLCPACKEEDIAAIAAVVAFFLISAAVTRRRKAKRCRKWREAE